MQAHHRRHRMPIPAAPTAVVPIRHARAHPAARSASRAPSCSPGRRTSSARRSVVQRPGRQGSRLACGLRSCAHPGIAGQMSRRPAGDQRRGPGVLRHAGQTRECAAGLCSQAWSSKVCGCARGGQDRGSRRMRKTYAPVWGIGLRCQCSLIGQAMSSDTPRFILVAVSQRHHVSHSIESGRPTLAARLQLRRQLHGLVVDALRRLARPAPDVPAGRGSG